MDFKIVLVIVRPEDESRAAMEPDEEFQGEEVAVAEKSAEYMGYAAVDDRPLDLVLRLLDAYFLDQPAVVQPHGMGTVS
ncbi:MAG: hypothetical protein HY922_00980 [Elusimicrobia bacterium]|nr:hypothetical protein [Elusimicrobiota bacterium]